MFGNVVMAIPRLDTHTTWQILFPFEMQRTFLQLKVKTKNFTSISRKEMAHPIATGRDH
jgi:hypothetical protein